MTNNKYDGEKIIFIEVKDRKSAVRRLRKLATLLEEERETDDYTQTAFFFNDLGDIPKIAKTTKKKKDIIKGLIDNL